MALVQNETALVTVERIKWIDCLQNLKYCLVAYDKHPYRFDEGFAHPDKNEDFVDFTKISSLNMNVLKKYKCLGTSIQASKICAIDIDDCISDNGLSTLAKEIIEMFKDTYIETSPSGNGLRILFLCDKIDDYSTHYYIKNSKQHVEFYSYWSTSRYVTITGNRLLSNDIIKTYDTSYVVNFLEKYMKRSIEVKNVKVIDDNSSIEDLMKKVKTLYLIDNLFQNLWFGKAPGSGSNESDLDWHLVAMIYENITQNKDKLRQIFELSPYYSSKDGKHKHKWSYNNYRYYDYIYNRIASRS